MDSCGFYLHQKSNLGLLSEEGFGNCGDEEDKLDSISSSSESSSIASDSSMEEEEEEEDQEDCEEQGLEEVTSSSSSSSSLEHQQIDSNGSLQDMSSLLQQLPFRRGLSKHYQGKSQSFTSLSNVLSLEDLAKPENPYNKKLKSCRSYACGLADQNNHPNSFSKIISKKASRGSCFSQMSSKRNPSGFLGNKPPMAPHRSTSTNALFA